MDSKILMLRRQKGAEFGRLVENNIREGKLGAFSMIPLPSGRFSRCTLGNRVCRIEVNCGLDNKKLLASLDDATLPHLVAWDNMEAKPVSYICGRYVAIEAPWESHLQRNDVRLDSVGGLKNDRFVVGVNEFGKTITIRLSDIIHLLVGGETGSGKSWTLRSAAYQLSGYRNRLVLLDGKYGEGLGICNGLKGQVGPVAKDRQTIINALGWCFQEMRGRYNILEHRGGKAFSEKDRNAPPHIVIIFDEFQEFTEDGKDPVIVEALRKLATQGRAARIHLWVGTQKPVQAMFGRTATRDQFSAAIGGKVRSYHAYHASEAIMGGNEPRCDKLLPKGDAYVKAMMVDEQDLIQRVQVAYVPENDIVNFASGQSELATWPWFDESELDVVEQKPGRKADCLTPPEIAVSIAADLGGYGVPWIRDRVGEIPQHRRPGNSKGSRIQEFGREVNEHLRKMHDISSGERDALPSRIGERCASDISGFLRP